MAGPRLSRSDRRRAARGARGVPVAVAAIGVLLLAVAALFVLRAPDAERPAAAPSAVETAREETEPPSAEPAPPSTRPSAEASVTPQATGLEGDAFTADPKAVASARPAEVAEGYDGCDHNYGSVSQCVPWRFPDGISRVPDKCEWLKLNGFRDLPVVGKDRQGLDPDGDKIACNS